MFIGTIQVEQLAFIGNGKTIRRDHMALFNTPERFGSLIKLLHWLIFILVTLQYSIMIRRIYIPEQAPDNLWYMLLHKSFGLVVLGVAALMIVSRQFGQRPPYPPGAPYQNLLAKVVHFLLYACLILMPLGGILMTVFSGRALAIFGYPLISADFIEPNKALSNFFYTGHIVAAYILLALILPHVIAVLYHHFILKDRVLSRMGFEKRTGSK